MRSTAGVVVGVVLSLLASCRTLSGCGPYLSPADAYAIELAACSKVVDQDKRLGCIHMVELKYGNYNGNGAYPSGQTPGPSR